MFRSACLSVIALSALFVSACGDTPSPSSSAPATASSSSAPTTSGQTASCDFRVSAPGGSSTPDASTTPSSSNNSVLLRVSGSADCTGELPALSKSVASNGGTVTAASSADFTGTVLCSKTSSGLTLDIYSDGNDTFATNFCTGFNSVSTSPSPTDTAAGTPSATP